MHDTPFYLAAGMIILLLFIFGFIGRKIHVPGVILYIVLGIILGGLISDNAVLDIASKIGIILMFFLLGLEFPMSKLGETAKKVWSGGLLNIALNLGVPFLICYFFGLNFLTSFLISGAVYATSSSITAKLLESTKRMANIESEYILGLLIFEDLVAPILVAVLIGLTSGQKVTGGQLGLLVLKIAVLALIAILLGRYVFSKLSNFIERINDEDIFILFTVGIAVAYGGLAVYLGLSEVLGAFLAGMMLAETNEIEEIEITTIPVRDLLLPLFFLSFGSTIDLSHGVPMIGLLIVMLIWSIIAKILVGVVGGRWYGLSKRVSLRAGLSITSRGEFSVVIASLASGTTKVFSGIYILIAAFIGIVLFIFAPKITTKIYGSPKKPKKKIKVPEG
ncbi:CPA2 family monovalent cation:H+ antiporter-2 [Scopulibacillus daqui]|uniref:CPA2 family monovalent cation:H+ antiporter-2 n=1 Tax=Scopulibacillus daqui TaxID=1469162 RepID=A0ABS2Q586_9BACL|nr:cation:proton antiporter [Scopulibacillus daqui]MBM7646657.1 CPA2 family monovalent cation:H+ antiporter-2 [Scopulibacillus daqui]